MYKKIKESQVPKRARKAESRFERTEEWRLMKADIDRGLKPQEASMVVLTPEDKKKFRIKNRRTIARFIQKYLDSNGMKYRLKTFNRDGEDHIIVSHTPVVRQIA
jgi:hypothetical protein